MKAFLPPLTLQEENACVERMKSGSLEDRRRLVEHNMRLVAHIVKKHSCMGEDQSELISIGTIGLIKAVDAFCPNKGNRLSTYAARCIENELFMYFRNKKKIAREVSIYEPVGTDKEGNTISIFDVLQVDEIDVVADLELKQNLKKLKEIWPQVLNDREQEILMHRYGIGGGKALTQREIAANFGISRSYVSRLEKRALEKLRVGFEEKL